jgi:hypothetical protein
MLCTIEHHDTGLYWDDEAGSISSTPCYYTHKEARRVLEKEVDEDLIIIYVREWGEVKIEQDGDGEPIVQYYNLVVETHTGDNVPGGTWTERKLQYAYSADRWGVIKRQGI